MPADQAARLRRALAREVARLTARLHDAGFLHHDFHPGNLLVRLGNAGRIELTMIDLDALRRPRRLELNAVRDNLALLNHYFWSRCERTDRLRFLEHYLEARGKVVDVAAFARSIEYATRGWAERLWRRWSRRCHGTNKYFHDYQNKDAWAVASRAVDASTVHQLLAQPDAPFTDPETHIIKSSRTTIVAEAILDVEGVPTRVIYKRFNCKKWLDPLWNLLRPTRGWRAWQAAQHFFCRGIPTPRNLLYLQRGGGGTALGFVGHRLPHYCYIATEKAHPAQTLADYARGILPTLDANLRKQVGQGLCRALARLIRSLHERSLSHRDLKAANILIVGDPEQAHPELTLIDLVGAELRHPLPRGRLVQNLARLYLSLAETPGRTRTDYLRFLRLYLRWTDTEPEVWKRLWRDVARAGRTKRLQNERRGRPLS